MSWLEGNKTCRVPTHHVVLDTETVCDNDPSVYTRGVHRLRYGCAKAFRWKKGGCDTGLSCEFTRPETFWTWLEAVLPARRSTWIWAHKMSFDFAALCGWEQIESGLLKWRWLCEEDPPFVLRGSIAGKPVTFVDSLNWYRCTLAELGESVDLPKLDRPETIGTDVQTIAYCRRDVDILERGVRRILSLVTEWDLGCLKTTVAAQAMQLYRHRLALAVPGDELPPRLIERQQERRCKFVYPVPHTSEDIREVEQSAFIGLGSTAFYVGEMRGPITALDCQSFYPSVMAGNWFPARLIETVHKPSIRTLAKLLRRHAVIATVDVDTPYYEYPVRTDDGIVRAIGRYTAALCGPELEHAIRENDLVCCRSAVVYQRLKLFDCYVHQVWDWLYQCERQGDLAMRSLVKALGVSLWGKFAQRSSFWRDRAGIHPPKPWGRWFHKDSAEEMSGEHRAIGGRVQRRLPDELSRHACPAVAAYVCSYARLKVREWIDSALPSNCPYFCADTVHVNADGYNRLCADDHVAEGEYGKLHTTATYGHVRYLSGQRFVADGVPHVAGLPTGSERVGRTLYISDLFARAREIIERGPVGGVPVVSREVNIELDPYAGSVPAPGWQFPLLLGREKRDRKK